jgi:effector-binding domain-containing protein
MVEDRMGYVIETVEVEATPLASITRRVAWTELAQEIRARFDRIYAFIRANGVAQQGHNVCIYRAPDSSGIGLECGVQVAGPFDGDGEVACSATPGGRALRTVHRGPYHELGKAADALFAWCAAHDIKGAGPSWEVYGDPVDDPAQLETTVYCRLP